jgi:hypothetical protein
MEEQHQLSNFDPPGFDLDYDDSKVDAEVVAFFTGAVPDPSPLVVSNRSNNVEHSEEDGPFSLERTVQNEELTEEQIINEVQQRTQEEQDSQINNAVHQIQSQPKLTPQERGKRLAEINKRRKQLHIKRKTVAQKAGIFFPVTKIVKTLKKIYPQKRISNETGVYLATVLEYMVNQVYLKHINQLTQI